MIIRSPLNEVIRDIKCGWIWARVLEINDDYLETTDGLTRHGMNVSSIVPDDNPWGSVNEGSSVTGSRTAHHYVPALACRGLPWFQ